RPAAKALIKEEKKARNADRPTLAGACTRVTIRHARKRANMGNLWALPRILWSRLRRVQDDAFAEQAEAGAAVHLALEHLDLIDGALDSAGVPVQGKAV